MTMQRSQAIFLALLSFTGLTSRADEPAPIDPSKWDADIAAFAARDSRTPPPKDALLFVGSSTIRMWDLETSWPGEKLLNNGFGGSTLPDAIHHFEPLVAAHEPRAVVLYSGDNDIGRERSVAQVTEDFKTFATLSRKTHPGVPVVILAIKPSIKRWSLWSRMEQVNAAVKAFCETTPGLFYADIATPMLGPDCGMPSATWFKADGLHLSPEGYAAWKKVIDDVLRQAGALH
jgi:lysophospholipase L1-like esterase